MCMSILGAGAPGIPRAWAAAMDGQTRLPRKLLLNTALAPGHLFDMAM